MNKDDSDWDGNYHGHLRCSWRYITESSLQETLSGEHRSLTAPCCCIFPLGSAAAFLLRPHFAQAIPTQWHSTKIPGIGLLWWTVFALGSPLAWWRLSQSYTVSAALHNPSHIPPSFPLFLKGQTCILVQRLTPPTPAPPHYPSVFLCR